MITPYVSQQPIDDFGLRFTDLKYSAAVAATTDTTLVIPGSAPRYKAVIKVKENGTVWVANNATAAVPAGGTFAVTTSELIPNKGLCREVIAGDTLHFYSTSGSDVSIVLYSIGTTN